MTKDRYDAVKLSISQFGDRTAFLDSIDTFRSRRNQRFQCISNFSTKLTLITAVKIWAVVVLVIVVSEFALARVSVKRRKFLAGVGFLLVQLPLELPSQSSNRLRARNRLKRSVRSIHSSVE